MPAPRSPNPVAPDFLVIGTAKAGTTSLHHILSTHPDVCLSTPKETWFFDGPAYAQGVDHYLARHFAEARPGQLRGEVATSYLYAPFVAERLAQAAPGARLIAILRDPVERAFSDWWMMHSRGWEPLSFEEAIADNLRRLEEGPDFSDPADWVAHLDAIRRDGRIRHRTYVDYGFYGEQLARYAAQGFGPDRLLVLQFEQLRRQGPGYFDQVHAFLGLDKPAPEALEQTATPQNEALPSRRIGQAVHLLHRTGVSRLVPTGVKDAAKRVLGRMQRSQTMAPGTRAMLSELYRERLLQGTGTARLDGGLEGFDMGLWKSMAPASRVREKS